MSGAVADQMPQNGLDRYERLVKDLQRQINDLRAARTLDAATITAAAGLGIRTADFDGTDFAHPGTAGNYFGGDGAVLNNLFLRAGSVSNDALTNPVAAGAVFSTLTNFSLSTTLTNIKTVNLTVPPGFTQIAITVTSRCYAVNGHTSGGYDGLGGDYLYCQSNVNGYNGYALPLPVSGSGGSGFNVSPFSVVMPGLTPGGTVSVQIAAGTSYFSWAANASNVAEVSGSVMWFR